MSWSTEWKHQLQNLNRICLWMMCAEEIDDDAALAAVTELKVWLARIERLLLATKGDEQ